MKKRLAGDDGMAAAEAVASNIDILTQILLLIPAKPLLKLKCVSKQWCTLISSPHFRHSHTLLHHSPHSLPSALLLNNNYRPSPHFHLVPLLHHLPRVPYFDYFHVPRVTILQSSNGLLLCSSTYLVPLQHTHMYVPSDFCPNVDHCGFRYFVCNPTTKEFHVVHLPERAVRDRLITLNLAFDPARSMFYKVLAVSSGVLGVTDDGPSLEIRVYDSKSGCWSERGVCFVGPFSMAIHAGVYCNGAVHWASQGEDSVCFDVESQCLRTLPMPPDSEDWEFGSVAYFGESRGHLHMVVLSEPNQRVVFDILEIREDYSGWFVRYHVDLTPMQDSFPELIWFFKEKSQTLTILCVVRQPREEDSMVVILVDGRVMSFNLMNFTSRQLCDLELCAMPDGCAPFSHEPSEAFQYFESLSLLGPSTP